MIATVSIRAMTLDEVDPVVALERSVFPDPWSRDAFTNETGGGPRRWSRVAVEPDSGEVVGYLVAWLVVDEAHLGNVAVAPRNRRRGVAQALLDDLIAEGKQRDARLVTLEVRRSNRAAQDFYRKNGFYTVMIRRGYYQDNREDALVMVKPLNEAGRIPPHASVR